MWNPKLTILPLLAVGLVAVQSSAPAAAPALPPQDQGTALKIQLLESRVEALEGYIANQAKAAEKLQTAIGSAVDAGFTAGINFKAREILVAAWKEQAKAAIDTGSGKKSTDEKSSDRRRR